ncbi:MAG: hypothetical protein KGM24_04530, partial [Elusimicrobia bacterium]|nr:hypothetical protein [Elusimicrobiota bacterium]
AREAAALGGSAAAAGDATLAKEAAAAPFDGGAISPNVVSPDGRSVVRSGVRLKKPTDRPAVKAADIPTPGADREPRSRKLSGDLVLGGAAALGGLQGWFSAGLVGAGAGALLGLGAAWLFQKKDYGGAFGATAGGIVGAALGGPLGGVVGAVLGGLLGHVLGRLFL